jgi:hypothetical protein
MKTVFLMTLKSWRVVRNETLRCQTQNNLDRRVVKGMAPDVLSQWADEATVDRNNQQVTAVPAKFPGFLVLGAQVIGILTNEPAV